MYGEHVFATGLQDRAIFKIAAGDGSIIGRNGTRGWNMDQGEFLWPTGIASDAAGNLYVADAHAGMVGKFDKDTLKPITVFGAR